ncbi:MAG TPA: metalloregulator ArsR/SmtB family transcription factor [Actinophytocola sp.]|nr:metalloregulator ArsR/SmtB family transcription factor [Actinophytocola sp.]
MVGDAALDALGDPNRREILRVLAGGGYSVQEIADRLPISRPAVSRHLKLLRGAGLVVEEPRGTRRIYRLHEDGVRAVEEYLREVWGSVANRFTIAAENLPEER